jgi:oligopeptide/dipeptide ABC transporter ATP-binding protein
MTLLELQDVRTHFPVETGFLFDRRAGVVKAVDGVSLRIARNETLGLVGESGCGKSTLARAILRLAPLTSGRVLYDGTDLAALSKEEMRARRLKIQVIFQDPYASLNPRMTVYDAIAEPIRAHRLAPRREVPRLVAELMDQVELSPRLMRKYPHEFSGGQRQRIAIARALALRPECILADEPVSALDVSVQAGVLNLFAQLRRERNLTLLFISHDLAVVRHLAHRIAVMYLGRIVETGPTARVFGSPLHPYTQALLSAAPLPDPDAEARRGIRLPKGDPPSPLNPPAGCAFHPRCALARADCALTTPDLVEHEPGHSAACLRTKC